MEMPERCGECCFCNGDWGSYICDRTMSMIGDVEIGYKRLYNCPLVEVKTPHGRLVDGDKLAAGCDSPHYCRWLSEIEDMPTILEAEG
jgi:hypothetical protein